MKTFSAKPADVTRTWYLIDASNVPLGRVATKAASLLIGKGKPSVTPHVDGGDYVIVTNTDNLRFTGSKLEGKTYYRHTQYPGGIKKESLSEKMAKDSTDVLYKSVRGMIPVNKLRDGRLQRLKIYPDNNQPHDPQKPQVISLKGNK